MTKSLAKKLRFKERLYTIRMVEGSTAISSSMPGNDVTKLWHMRLGHMSEKDIHLLSKQVHLGKHDISKLEFCKHCVFGKQKKVWVYFLWHKNDTFSTFKKWKTLVETQTWKKTKKLRTDNGLEFCNGDFNELCTNNGIARHKIIPRNPQQNGVAERMNMTLLERARCMLSHAGLWLWRKFWAEAASIACYLVNRSPHSVLDFKILEKIWSGNLQGTSEKLELIVKPTTPNVDVPSSSTNQSSIDDCYVDNDDSTTSSIHQQEDYYLAQEVNDVAEPANYTEVVSCAYSSQWRVAMNEEIEVFIRIWIFSTPLAAHFKLSLDICPNTEQEMELLRPYQFGAFILATMPPKTTNKDADDTLVQILTDKLKEQQEQQDSRHESIAEALRCITEKLAGMNTIPPQPPEPPHLSLTQPGSSHVSNPNPNLNPFDGSEPLDWLFQAEQFFQLYQVPPDQRLHIISFYMKGEALSWFKWAFHNATFLDWDNFTRCLESIFGPSCYENHQAELFKLRQTGSVAEYQRQFEKLCNRIWGLSPEIILNCFLSGLIPEIRRELAVLRPTHIADALGLAKLVESKIKDSKPTFPRTSRFPPFPPHSNQPPHPRPTYQPATTSTNPPTQTALPIRRLTIAQMQERRAQGLCYNCDEKYHSGHKCQPKQFMLMLVNDLDSTEEQLLSSMETVDEDIQPSPDELIHFQLSEQALEGQPSPKTLRFQGSIAGHSVTVLVDTGSSHNVLQPRLAHYLQLDVDPTPNFPVMVGNGAYIYCTGLCPNTPLQLKNQLFYIPFYLLPIKGADVVLGIEWLRTLGPVTSDFAVPSMSFKVEENTITLQGETTTSISPSTFHQLFRLLYTDSIASFHTITFLPLLNGTTNNTTTTPPLNSQIQTLLTRFYKNFHNPHGLPPSRPHDHSIPLLPNTAPVSVRPYRYPHSQKDIMTKMIQDMLTEGIITPSTSPFSSPVLLVKKKDGTWRFCVDYRALNAITIHDRFPISTIDELLDELGAATIFSKIDLRSGYHQIRVNANDTAKTAFRTFDGHYEFLVMPFGLTNAPSTFQAAMNDLLRPHLRRFALVFFDDILIYSSCLTDHLLHLSIILDLLVSNQFYAKLSKCLFGVDTVSYLGHIISAGVVRPDPDKIKAMQEWPQPRSHTTLRGFLGLTGFYRKFVKNYAALAAPLTDLLRLQQFTWPNEAHSAFTNLKNAMSTTPVLHLPDFSLTFDVETDASAVAIGAVLSQGGHPLAFFSKKMTPRMQHSSAYVREMFAVTESVKKWRQYLIGRKFTIYTDQQSLKHLMTQGFHTPEQQKWATKLIGFTFDIKYRLGTSNRVADALSRCHSEESGQCYSMTSVTPQLLDRLHSYYQTPAGQAVIQQNISDQFHFSHGYLFYQQKLFIPAIEDFRLTLVKEFHETPVAGHSGWRPTLARLTASCSWPGVSKDIKKFVRECAICQSNKSLPQKTQGLL
ncbi:PREDICTED: uncharacterized protein LOC109359708 [Lupinus angustifolius]|uniref:uncharacterized protein LOC109359708 n=1 Tax=Lupinus angustifolius TaxID=3871 RepID=UPI00092F189D|nr:PREDICTED: uncharacterized protein LOC109359708 [Lupinus angustifolius]